MDRNDLFLDVLLLSEVKFEIRCSFAFGIKAENVLLLTFIVLLVLELKIEIECSFIFGTEV